MSRSRSGKARVAPASGPKALRAVPTRVLVEHVRARVAAQLHSVDAALDKSSFPTDSYVALLKSYRAAAGELADLPDRYARLDCVSLGLRLLFGDVGRDALSSVESAAKHQVVLKRASFPLVVAELVARVNEEIATARKVAERLGSLPAPVTDCFVALESTLPSLEPLPRYYETAAELTSVLQRLANLGLRGLKPPGSDDAPAPGSPSARASDSAPSGAPSDASPNASAVSPSSGESMRPAAATSAAPPGASAPPRSSPSASGPGPINFPT